MNKRDEFLTKMYDQMFNDINQHILVSWQSIGVLIAAFALLSLTEKGVLSIDIAASLIILVCAWLIAHLYDASYWYNRNLVIIANIERQFLKVEDLKLIHYYFGVHRPKNKMIFHFRIQYALGGTLGIIVLIYHFVTKVKPTLSLSHEIDYLILLPYLLTLASIIYLRYIAKQRLDSYQEFISNSPGKKIDTTGIKYGIGHGYKA